MKNSSAHDPIFISPNNSLKIFVLGFNEKLDEKVFTRLTSYVGEEKRKRIGKFYRWQDAQRCLLGDLLTRKVIRETYGLKNEEIIFSLSNYGKPFLKEFSKIHFNLSHSGNFVVCAIDSENVGIDVEEKGNLDLSISKNFFVENEHKVITDSVDQLDKFFELWTLKESYLKFTGKGLSLQLNSFSIVFTENAPIRVKQNDNSISDVFLKKYDLTESYIMSICSAHNNFPINYAIYSVNDIVTEI